MAPQGTLVDPTPTVQPSALAPAGASHNPFIPVALLIFLGLCFAYTFSYILYRIVMSRRRESEDDIPDSPDRGVSQFMSTSSFVRVRCIAVTVAHRCYLPRRRPPHVEFWPQSQVYSSHSGRVT
jgi:hypothetical protein